jgi:hypothetical protein
MLKRQPVMVSSWSDKGCTTPFLASELDLICCNCNWLGWPDPERLKVDMDQFQLLQKKLG